MWMHASLWDIDPLPVSLAPYGSMAWWRWWSALTLAQRRTS